MLRYMAIGDVTSAKAAQALAKALWDIRKQYRIDFVAVNAENAGFIVDRFVGFDYQGIYYSAAIYAHKP